MLWCPKAVFYFLLRLSIYAPSHAKPGNLQRCQERLDKMEKEIRAKFVLLNLQGLEGKLGFGDSRV